MKKIFLLFVTLCLVHIISAQVKVNSVGNTGIGGTPNAKAKLLLYNNSDLNAALDTTFGLHSNLVRTAFEVPLYGAYFKNRILPFDLMRTFCYGVYIDNNNQSDSNISYGVYVNNSGKGHYANTMYGNYVNNTST